MMEKKKILIACDSPRSLLDFRGKLIEALIPNHEVTVFTPRIDEQNIREKLAGFNVKVYESDLNTSNVSVLADLRYMISLHRLMRTLKPDVFFPYAFKPVIYGALVARYCKVGSIRPMLTGLGYNYLQQGRRPTLIQTITRSLLKISLRPSDNLSIILQNEDDYHTLLNARTISKKNSAFVVHGSGVDLTYYPYSTPEKSKITFLMISRLINAKGVQEYYEAAKIIKSRYPEVTFQLVGPYDNNIDAISPALFDRIKSDGVLQYYGLQQDVRPLIEKSSVVVLPSYYGEGVPRSLLEAMAMGRALITSNSVGCKETVTSNLHKINGFLVPVKNVKQLVFRMEHFIKYPDDIVKFGINGRAYAEEKFDVKKINQRMLQILLDAKN